MGLMMNIMRFKYNIILYFSILIWYDYEGYYKKKKNKQTQTLNIKTV